MLAASIAKIARKITPDVQPLKIPAFRSLYIGGIAPAIGAAITFIVIQQQIYSTTGQSAMVGFSSIIMMIPVVVFGLAGGAIADRFDRRKVLLITTTGVGLSAAALGVVSVRGHTDVATIVAIASVQQAFFAVNQPTRQAIVPRLIPTSDLPAANGLLFSLFAVSVLLGPLLGGILLASTPVGLIYFIEAAGTLPMVAVIARLPSVVPAKHLEPKVRGARSESSQLWSPLVRNVLFLDLAVTVGSQPRALFPSMAAHDLSDQMNPGLVLGLLNSSAALGFLIGIATGSWLRSLKHPGRGMIVAAAVGSVTVAGASMKSALPTVIACLIMFGWATIVSSICRNTILQSALHDSVRGRAQGLLTVVTASGPRVADLLHGALADATSNQTAILIGAALALSAVFAIGMRSRALVHWTPT